MIKFGKLKKIVTVSGLLLAFSLGATYGSTSSIQANLLSVSNVSGAPWWGLSANQLWIASNMFEALWPEGPYYKSEINQINIPNGNIGPGVLMLCAEVGLGMTANCSDAWVPMSTPSQISNSQRLPTFTYSVIAQNTSENGPASESLNVQNNSYPYAQLVIEDKPGDKTCKQYISNSGMVTQTYNIPPNDQQANMVFSADVTIVNRTLWGQNNTPVAALSNCSLTPAH